MISQPSILTITPQGHPEKFLGITLDSKLSFLPYIKQLSIKWRQTIQLLSAIPHTDMDADKKTLIKQYKPLNDQRLIMVVLYTE